MRTRHFLLVLLLATGIVAGQESASFKLSETTLNAGGHPAGGTVITSSSYGITLDAIGEAVAPAQAASTSYLFEGGFVGTFAPPGEVANVRFSDATTLLWDTERSTGGYAVYSGPITEPFDSGYGTCQRPPPPLTATTTPMGSI